MAKVYQKILIPYKKHNQYCHGFGIQPQIIEKQLFGVCSMCGKKIETYINTNSRYKPRERTQMPADSDLDHYIESLVL